MTETIIILLVIFGAVLGALGIISFTFLKLVQGRRSDQLNTDEAEIMQEMYHGFTKLESRIESLETLVLEREGKGGVS